MLPISKKLSAPAADRSGTDPPETGPWPAHKVVGSLLDPAPLDHKKTPQYKVFGVFPFFPMCTLDHFRHMGQAPASARPA